MVPNRKDSRYNWEILKILFIWFVICGCVIFQRIFFNQCYTLNILEIKFSLVISYDIAKSSRIPFDADITCQTSFIKKLPFTSYTLHRSRIDTLGTLGIELRRIIKFVSRYVQFYLQIYSF